MGVYFASGAMNDFTNRSWNLGWQFNLLAPIDVTALGFYDDGANGLTESHAVGIFSSAGSLIVSATVQPGDPLSDWWRFASISPVLLPAGEGYRIAAITGSENYTWGPAGFGTGPGVVFVTDRYSTSGALAFPTQSDGGTTGYFGPNFLYDFHQYPDPGPGPGPDPNPIPEPSTRLLLSGALILLASIRLLAHR
jgi:hypothetical protein